jgi:membrane fusion protein (multidrug efflux system)
MPTASPFTLYALRTLRSSSIIFISVLIVTACDFIDSESKVTEVPASKPLPKVSFLKIEPKPLALTSELTGRTSPYRIAEVRPQVSGIILDRAFSEGERVEVGQILYKIDPANYQAEYDRAKATLARDEAALTTARLKAERYAGLVKAKSVSQEAYEEADAALKQAQANIAMDKALLQSARIALNYTHVSAPIAGYIGRSNVTQGALVTANQVTSLATIRQLDPIYVDVTQSSVDLLRLKRALSRGDVQRPDPLHPKVELILEDGSKYPHKGQLKFSEMMVDEKTGSITIRALFPNPDQQLLPGMYVRAIVQEGIKQNAILVPQQAVTRDANGNASTLTINSESIVEPRQLTIARAVGNQWLINDGLKADDQVIIKGLQKVRPGDKADAVEIMSSKQEKPSPHTSN